MYLLCLRVKFSHYKQNRYALITEYSRTIPIKNSLAFLQNSVKIMSNDNAFIVILTKIIPYSFPFFVKKLILYKLKIKKLYFL